MPCELNGDGVILGFSHKDAELADGEAMIFSADKDGLKKACVILRGDGKIEAKNDKATVTVDKDGNIAVKAQSVKIECSGGAQISAKEIRISGGDTGETLVI